MLYFCKFSLSLIGLSRLDGDTLDPHISLGIVLIDLVFHIRANHLKFGNSNGESI
jgi:hypothetical protein